MLSDSSGSSRRIPTGHIELRVPGPLRLTLARPFCTTAPMNAAALASISSSWCPARSHRRTGEWNLGRSGVPAVAYHDDRGRRFADVVLHPARFVCANDYALKAPWAVVVSAIARRANAQQSTFKPEAGKMSRVPTPEVMVELMLDPEGHPGRLRDRSRFRRRAQCHRRSQARCERARVSNGHGGTRNDWPWRRVADKAQFVQGDMFRRPPKPTWRSSSFRATCSAREKFLGVRQARASSQYVQHPGLGSRS
jgi:hypothetical protein